MKACGCATRAPKAGARPLSVIVDVGHPTSIVFALDLSLVVPFLWLGGIWLWQRRPWGYLLAALSTVKGTVYLLALAVASAFQAQVGFAEALAQLPLWGLLSLGFLVTALFLLGNAEPKNQTEPTFSQP